jgi:hypothetical protein
LEESHLCGSILHGDSIGFESEIRSASDVGTMVGVGEQSLCRIVKVRIENLLSQCQRSFRAKDPSNFGKSSK